MHMVRTVTFCFWAALLPSMTQAMECDPSTMNCSPLVACVEETGELFKGASFGRDAGPFQATSQTGTVCTGKWSRTFLGIGVAEFTCDDGRAGSAVYTWFEAESGTAVGQGEFTNGTIGRFWSGNNLKRYFSEVDPAEQERMACNPAPMLLG